MNRYLQKKESKRKVIVEKADDYYQISPLKAFQPPQLNPQNDPTFPQYVSQTHDVNVLQEIAANRVQCDICKNNGPSSSSHICTNVKNDVGFNHKVPAILRKSRNNKTPSKKCDDVALNLSSKLQNVPQSKTVHVAKTPKRSYVRKSGKKIKKPDKKQQTPRARDVTDPANLVQGTVKSYDLTYSESVNEAIVMDLLDKKYGNVLETALSTEIETKNVRNNPLAVTVPSSGSEIKDEIETCFELPGDLTETTVKKEASVIKSETSEAIETILILDSPDKNYCLFSPHELKCLPRKIFDSPGEPIIKEEVGSPSNESLNDTVESYPPDNDSGNINCDILGVNNDNISEAVGDNICEGVEGTLEISSEPPSNIFGDETYHQLMASMVVHGNCDKFPYVARDVEVITTENLISQTVEIDNPQSKDETSEISQTETVVPLEKSPSGAKKIWEIKPQDIDFDILKDSDSPKPEQQKKPVLIEDVENVFLGFPNKTSNDDTDKCGKCLEDILTYISRETFSKEVKDPSKEVVSSNTVKSTEENEVLVENSLNGQETSDLLPHEVVSQCSETIIISSTNKSRTDNPNAAKKDTEDIEIASSNITESLDVRVDCVTETTIIAIEDWDLNLELEVATNKDKLSSEITSDNLQIIPTEPLNASPQIDIAKCDILIMNESGSFQPLNEESIGSIRGNNTDYAREEHCYYSLSNVDKGTVKEDPLEPSDPESSTAEENNEQPNARPLASPTNISADAPTGFSYNKDTVKENPVESNPEISLAEGNDEQSNASSLASSRNILADALTELSYNKDTVKEIPVEPNPEISKAKGNNEQPNISPLAPPRNILADVPAGFSYNKDSVTKHPVESNLDSLAAEGNNTLPNASPLASPINFLADASTSLGIEFNQGRVLRQTLDPRKAAKDVVKTDTELMELKRKIMEGKMDKEEILEIIESKNIIQCNVKVQLPSDNRLDQQKCDAKHLASCLKKQIDVMKKNYAYFEDILESTEKLLDANITEVGMKNIFDNLYFVKNIVDKMFPYCNTGRGKENKVKYRVINITKKDVKQPEMKGTSREPLQKKRTSNKLLPKMLYRMNKLLEYLEVQHNLIRIRKIGILIQKLKHGIEARRDCTKLKTKSTVQEMQKTNIISHNLEKLNIAAIPMTESCSAPGPKAKKILSSIENVPVSSVNPHKPIITPISKDVKIILSQIEQLNSRGNPSERSTTAEVHKKILEGKLRRVGKKKAERVAQDKFVCNEGKPDRVVLVEASPKRNEGIAKVSSAGPKKVTPIKKRESKKKKDQENVNYETDDESIADSVSSRYSRRSRKPPDFFSSEKYSSKNPPEPKFTVDISNLKSKSQKPNRRGNISFELKNDGKPTVVLYDKTKPNSSNFQYNNESCKGFAKDSNKTDVPKIEPKVTKRNLRERKTEPLCTKRQLRSSCGKDKNATRN